jgi:hypothetical protein
MPDKSENNQSESESVITQLTEEINALKAERENLKPHRKSSKIGAIVCLAITLSYYFLVSTFFIYMGASGLDMPAWPIFFLLMLTPALIPAIIFVVFLIKYLKEKKKFDTRFEYFDHAISEKEQKLKRIQEGKITIPKNIDKNRTESILAITQLSEEITALKAVRENSKPHRKVLIIIAIVILVLSLSCLIFICTIAVISYAILPFFSSLQDFFLPVLTPALIFVVFLLICLKEKTKFKRTEQIKIAIIEKEKELRRNQEIVNGN